MIFISLSDEKQVHRSEELKLTSHQKKNLRGSEDQVLGHVSLEDQHYERNIRERPN